MAIGGAVIDHGDRLAFEFLHRVAAQGATELGVVSYHAEGCLEALAGVLGVGGGGRDLGNASVAVNLGRRNGGAGVEVADHADNLGVHQLLCDCGALLGVCSVVFGHQLDGDLLASDNHTGCVEFINGHDGAVFIVLAEVGNGAAGGAYVGDCHNFLRKNGASGNSQRRSRDRFNFHGNQTPSIWLNKREHLST